jgi:hypothetical protein
LTASADLASEPAKNGLGNGGRQEMKVLTNWLVAFGTILVAIVAIWGDFLRSKLAPPKLHIALYNTRGSLTKFKQGSRVIYYHLKVINSRPWFLARNCQVRLVGISSRGPDNQFRPLGNPVPQTFVWSPAGFVPMAANIAKEQIFDFGRILEGGQEFEPVLYSYPLNFEGRINANQAVRYTLDVVGENVSKTSPIVLEVAWNGRWSDNFDDMAQNLTIRQVSRVSS